MTIEKLVNFLQRYQDNLISRDQLLNFIHSESNPTALVDQLKQANTFGELDANTHEWLLDILTSDDKTHIAELDNDATHISKYNSDVTVIKPRTNAKRKPKTKTKNQTSARPSPTPKPISAIESQQQDSIKAATDQTIINEASTRQKSSAPAATPIAQESTGQHNAAEPIVTNLYSDDPEDITCPIISEQTIANKDIDNDSSITNIDPLNNGELPADTIIKDRFVIEGRIGRGGMGTVYKARDLRKEEALDKDSYIAIKFLNHGLRSHPQALIALQREAKKAQTLAHPNIVTVFDFDKDGEQAFLTMEYLEGQTLDQLILAHSNSGLVTTKAIPLIKSITRGLAYAHRKGYVHADLKPSNIFVTNDSQVKLLDFGIAQAVKHIDQKTQGDESRFDPYSLGAITPTFASPEMLEDKPPTTSDDIYSLGCICYALLTGRHPFTGKNGRKLTALKARAQGLKVQKMPGLAKRYHTAIEKCLAFDGADRYPQAVDFINAIDPRKKLRKGVVALFAALSIIAGASWWFAASRSEAAIDLSDLPASMSTLVESIRTGDTTFNAGDIDQAHKLYAQAWEASFETIGIDPRDQYKLKVILDRRLNNIIKQLLEDAQQPNLDEFRQLQLQVALEALKQGELGTLGDAIDPVLEKLSQ